MTLKKYKEKRDFNKTKEPKGKKESSKSSLIFVVQKHDATNLHYDFRLELDGVLKSWAVPKGPSLNPKDKRLAMMVEDHPYDYKDFEGTIPKGNYGAGKVIVWDKGSYESINAKTKSENVRSLRDGLEKGDLKFKLQGEKLKGEFALVNMKKPKQNAWLLIKKKDEFAQSEDILKQDASVISDRTLDDIEDDDKKNDVEKNDNNKKENVKSKKTKLKKETPNKEVKKKSF